MQLRSEVKSDLSDLVKAMANVEGVIAIILFGSRARGDYDEYSDYDLLVIFEDEEVMWRNRKKLFENVGKLRLFTQVLTRSIKEFAEKTEPTFRQNILEHGKLLYLRYPFQAPAFCENLKPMAIVSYDMRRLPQAEKMKVVYRLFGKKGKGQSICGVVEENGGLRLGDGCFMIPIEGLEAITQMMSECGVQFKVLRIYSSYSSKEDATIL